tara:strand:- start:333 stop:2276 length:1944 start_codon:yes stop_codon:yes gene_type:complete
MTDYKAIVGKGIKVVSTNIDNAEGEGQIWFNSTTGEFKDILNLQAWASSGSIVTARFGCGTADQGPQTAGLIFGGYTPSFTANTEEYNGAGFQVGGALPAAVADNKGCGTQTAALSFMGLSNPSTHIAESFEYDGSSWGSETDLNTSRYDGGGNGTQTAGLAYGGYTTTTSNATEEYNGSAWTSVNNMNTARYSFGHAGVQTSAVAVAGVTTTRVANTEEYDGTNWTAGTNYPATLGGLRGFGATNTAAVFAGGSSSPPTIVTTCNSYDGTSFSSIPALGNSASAGGTGGSSTAGIYMSGIRTAPGTVGGDTEEFTSSTNVFTPSAFAAGGNMPSGKRVGGSSTGGSIVALTFGGDDLPMAAGQPQIKSTEEYDGASWTAGGNLGNNVSRCAGSGTQTAGLGAGGYSTGTPWQTPNAAYIANAFEYDGSSWTNVTALPITMDGHTAFGIQTAAVYGAGSQGPNPSPGPAATYRSKNTFHYDGTNWTSGGALNEFHSDTDASAGTQTAGIVFGGYIGSPLPSSTSTLEEYDGSSWTTALSGLQVNSIGGGFGTQSLFLAAGGQNAPIPSSPGTTGYSLNSFLYNGTSMATDASIATRRVIVGCDGVVGTAAGMICGGSTSYSSRTTATEEYTQGSTALNIKTVDTTNI